MYPSIHRSWLALLLLTALPAPPPLRPQSLLFQTPLRLPASEAGTVLITDVNKDGKNDILAAGNGLLAVYLGNGKGAFTPANGSPFAAGPNPTDMATGDFNDDGNPDVAIANHGVQLVTVLLGNGKGSFSFAPGSPFPVPSNPHPHGITAADFNGDGKMDLAVDSWGENKLLVLFGHGDGTFQAAGKKLDAGKAPYRRLRSADLNGDGHPDLVTSNWQGSSISVLLGDGKGNFSRAGGIDVPVPDSPFGAAPGDFNGDGHPDIAVCHYSGHANDPGKNGLSVLWGDGRGHFTLEQGSPFPTGNYPAMVAAGDVDGDGIMDIATANSLDNTVTVYLGGKTGIKPAGRSPVPVGHGPECVAIGDLNGDGKGDIAVADQGDNEVLVLLSK